MEGLELWFSLGVWSGVRLLNHLAVLTLLFKGTSMLFSIAIVLIYIPNSVTVLCFLHTPPAFINIICRLFDVSHSDWCEVVLICVSLTMMFSIFFLCLLNVWMLLWRNVCLDLQPIFWLGCLFFWYWVVWAVCIFWRLVHCQLHHLQIFSLIL